MAARRLVLDTTGIKGPLEIGATAVEEPSEPPVTAATLPSPADAKPAPAPPRRRAARPRLVTSDSDQRPVPSQRFYGTGRPEQTSVAISPDLAQQLAELKRATGASVTALAVAAIHAGLPADNQHANRQIGDERLRRVDAGERIEHNLRLPAQLRARIDQFIHQAQEQNPRSTRADLINATLRVALPQQPAAAAELVREHARQLERAHASL